MAELLRDREAVAHGLSVMATRMLFENLPSVLEDIIGERQATIILERMAEEAAELGFKEFMRMLGIGDLRDMPIDKLLTIFSAPPPGRPKMHPFQVVRKIEVSDSRIVLEIEDGHRHPSEVGILAGTIAGVLTAAGYSARPLSGPDAVKHLCSSDNPPRYAVYPVKNGEWRIVIEGVKC